MACAKHETEARTEEPTLAEAEAAAATVLLRAAAVPHWPAHIACNRSQSHSEPAKWPEPMGANAQSSPLFMALAAAAAAASPVSAATLATGAAHVFPVRKHTCKHVQCVPCRKGHHACFCSSIMGKESTVRGFRLITVIVQGPLALRDGCQED